MSIVPGLNPDGTPQLNKLLGSTTKLKEETMGEANKLKGMFNLKPKNTPTEPPNRV
jgi:hypothetical protein